MRKKREGKVCSGEAEYVTYQWPRVASIVVGASKHFWSSVVAASHCKYVHVHHNVQQYSTVQNSIIQVSVGYLVVMRNKTIIVDK